MSNQNASLSRQPQGLVFRYCYRTVIRAVEERYDVRGSILAGLVRSCLENRARVPTKLSECYYCHVQREALNYLELFTESLLFGPHGRFSPHEYRYRMMSASDDKQ